MEKRKFVRVTTNRVVQVRLSNGRSVQARLVNISRNGLGFVYRVPAEVGAVFKLRFTLPVVGRIRQFAMQAHVVHTHITGDDYYTGMEILDASPEQLKLIDMFVNEKTNIVSENAA